MERDLGIPLSDFVLVADDVVGGAFAINGGALGPAAGNVFYFAPDRLAWEDMEAGHSAFVHWAIEGDLGSFYEGLRWPDWEAEIEQIGGDRTLSLYPPPWTKEGKDLSKVSRRAVPAREVWAMQQDVRSDVHATCSSSNSSCLRCKPQRRGADLEESTAMKSSDALREFKRLLAARGTTAARVSMPDGIEAMIDFYRNTRADDCSLDSDGDMLLFQWGTYDWGRGPEFEVDITRQFIRGDGEDDEIWQLSLTFFFPQNAIARGDRWCHSPDELDDFAMFVRTHDAYAADAHAAPVRVELDFECAG